MEAKELQIGDYVNYRGQIIKVTSLNDKGGSNEVGWGIYEELCVYATLVKPISITPEILEKNGFVKCEPQGYDLYIKDKEGAGLYRIFWQGEDYNYYLEVAAYVGDYGEFNKTNIKYVHQLQQVLRFCGIEKEIEL